MITINGRNIYGVDSGFKPDWKKVRKKPVVVKAFRTSVKLEIVTLEGVMVANLGDWIIMGVNGEVYPCKPDIFEKTYEKVN